MDHGIQAIGVMDDELPAWGQPCHGKVRRTAAEVEPSVVRFDPSYRTFTKGWAWASHSRWSTLAGFLHHQAAVLGRGSHSHCSGKPGVGELARLDDWPPGGPDLRTGQLVHGGHREREMAITGGQIGHLGGGEGNGAGDVRGFQVPGSVPRPWAVPGHRQPGTRGERRICPSGRTQPLITNCSVGAAEADDRSEAHGGLSFSPINPMALR